MPDPNLPIPTDTDRSGRGLRQRADDFSRERAEIERERGRSLQVIVEGPGARYARADKRKAKKK